MRTPDVYEISFFHLKALHQALIGGAQVTGLRETDNKKISVKAFRRIGELLDLLERGKSENFTSCEWSLLLRYTDKWSENAYQNIIIACREDSRVSNKLHNLFLKKGINQGSSFCKQVSKHKDELRSLSENWDIVINIWLKKQGYAQEFLENLVNKPNFRRKHLGKNHLASKNAWLWKKIGKRTLIDTLVGHEALKKTDQTAINYIINYWFLPCLDEINKKDSDYALSTVKELANRCVLKKGVDKCLAVKLQAMSFWLHRYVSISSNKKVWKSLSSLQREVFTIAMGETTYQDFKSVTSRLAKGYDQLKSNHLEKRSFFWKGYKQYFLDFTVFASGSSYDFLESQGNKVRSYKSSQDCVVFVVETESWIIVDFLMGDKEVVLIYPYSYRDQLTRDSLSYKIIKDLRPELVHDHRSYWQWSLYAMLRDKDLIGSNSSYQKKLSSEAFKSRERDLVRWKHERLASTAQYNRLIKYLHEIKE